jgi:hypothetical protein
VEDFESDQDPVTSDSDQVRLDAARIHNYVETTPETYAGHWRESDTLWVIAFTADIDRHRAEIVKMMSSPDEVRVVQFRFSYQHLLSVHDHIVGILGTTEGLTSWGPDVKGNCVLVRVLPDRLDEVRRTLMVTNPDDIRVELGTPIFPA